MRATLNAAGTFGKALDFIAHFAFWLRRFFGVRRNGPRTVPIVLAIILFIAPVSSHGSEVTIFAAASLKPVLEEVLADAPSETRSVYAASSALARQIERGAPADIFISASPDWMDALETTGALLSDTRRDIARNRLVLVGAAGSSSVTADTLADLAGQRIAVALTDAVPAGIYARAALTALGAWDALSFDLVQTQDVRAAVRLVETGAVPLAIVYATDAVGAPALNTVFVFPEASHPTIVYPGALTKQAHPEALAVLDHITRARSAFDRAGFLPPENP